MAVVLGTSSGFVTVAPSADPAGTGTTIDGSSVVTKHTAPAGATKINSIGWYRESGTNTANWEIALYSESAGVAATRLNVDATNSTASNGWLVTAVDWAITENTAYWLGLQMDAHSGSSGVDRADSGGVGSDLLAAQSTLNNPYGGGAVADADGMYAIYARVNITHAATGALVGTGKVIAGTAKHNVPHPSSGALTGPGAAIVGAASSATTRAATGALVGPGAAIVGSASSATTRAATGAVVGAGSVIAGEALREDAGPVVHESTGILAGPGAAIVGAASSATTRAATGAIVGAGSVIAGTASSKTTRAATGTIAGAGASLSGDAARVGAAVEHESSGILAGSGALIVGIAAKPADTSGALFDIPRKRIPVHHGASGRLQGKGATIRGNARVTRTGQNPLALLLTAA